MGEWINKLCNSYAMHYYTWIEKETGMSDNMNELQKHCIEQKKPIRKEYTLYHSICVKFKNKKN